MVLVVEEASDISALKNPNLSFNHVLTSYSLDIGTLDDGAKRVSQLVEGHPLDLLGRGAGDVPVADGILGDDNVPALLGALARGGGNADVGLEPQLALVLTFSLHPKQVRTIKTYHVADKDNLAPASSLQQNLQLSPRKRAGGLLVHCRLALGGLQLGEDLSQLGAGREDGGAGGGVVDDVDDGGLGGAVLVEEGLNHLARVLDTGDLELSLGVLVLGVDDDKDRVRRRGRGGLDADEGAERGGSHFGGG